MEDLAPTRQHIAKATVNERARRRPRGRVSTGAAEGISTRERILEAARQVFARHGYVGASIEHIVTLCHVSRGTFYYYFKNKEDIFEQLVLALSQAWDRVRASSNATDPYLRIEAANRAYLQMWADHHDIMANLFQIAAIEPRFEELHRGIRGRFVERIRRNLERELASRKCRDLDPVVASHALGEMVDSFAYRWLGERSVEIGYEDIEHVVAELSELWYHALYGGRPHEGGTDGAAR